ncbi:hypothetical protein EJ03DRAFT_355236 [Teratosphaeria nubilosa]|uniref:Uncharacterized protein n=1 Tax=Teratosphaeria nubilosa TaxID=161662 RepID=A0A6G1KXS6_9PEZI|nr:hypothetical protein EJ03DRAFT_355236 [Teratosphaeria nubilosa]
MGNCCGKPHSGNFHGEGRTLRAPPATAPAQPPRGSAAAPPNTGAGRTVGGAPSDASDPKAAAARAAEERAKATPGPKGKLGKQLDAQRTQTQADTLARNARDNVAQRDADANAAARNWN